MDFINWCSIFSSIVSLVLGVFAIYQSYKYNKKSKMLNDDTSRLMNDRTKKQYEILVILRELQSTINQIINGKRRIDLTKDELLIIKGSLFNEKRVDIIVEKINDLIPIAKPQYIESIQSFLTLSEDKEKTITLRRTLNKEDIEKLSELNRELLDFGVFLVWKNI